MLSVPPPGAPGVAADLAHINTPSIAEGFGPENNGLEKALKGSEVSVSCVCRCRCSSPANAPVWLFRSSSSPLASQESQA